MGFLLSLFYLEKVALYKRRCAELYKRKKEFLSMFAYSFIFLVVPVTDALLFEVFMYYLNSPSIVDLGSIGLKIALEFPDPMPPRGALKFLFF